MGETRKIRTHSIYHSCIAGGMRHVLAESTPDSIVERIVLALFSTAALCVVCGSIFLPVRQTGSAVSATKFIPLWRYVEVQRMTSFWPELVAWFFVASIRLSCFARFSLPLINKMVQLRSRNPLTSASNTVPAFK